MKQERYSFKQDPALKPLHSNLMRIGFAKYLLSDSFKHLKFELDLDHDWYECQKMAVGSGEQKADTAFFLFLNIVFDEKLLEEIDDFFYRILLDFINWSSSEVDLKQVFKSLRDLSFDEDTIKRIKSKSKKKRQTDTPKEPISSLNRNSLKVFIIHGHDDASRLILEKLLKEFRLQPIVLMDLPGESLSTIISKFEKEAAECGVAIALFTPDDEMKNGSRRPRQNVILELGYFMGRNQSERRIIILKKGSVEGPSDLHGVITINYINSVEEVESKLRKQLAHWKIIS